jgi:hypothetical protein
MSRSSNSQYVPTLQPGMPGYVARDWRVVDYDCYQLGETGLWFRGPQPEVLDSGSYFTALGAAHTFGCFVESPYPQLLQERLGVPALNLGYSGAGPAFFARHRELLEYVNRGAFCIVQVMSARSTSNSMFDNPEGLAYGKRREGGISTAEEMFEDLVTSELRRLPGGNRRLLRGLLKLTRMPIPAVRKVVKESRMNWLNSMYELLNAITVPKILFWFSTREMAYKSSYHNAGHLLGVYPHLVNRKMIDELRGMVDDTVVCISKEGLPQPLIDRFTGTPTTVMLESDVKPTRGLDADPLALYRGTWSENYYYPSPKMHHRATKTLEPSCRRWLSGEDTKQ